MNHQEDEGIDFESLPKEAKGPCKPALYDFGDAIRREQEEHFVLAAICNKMNSVWEMHTIASHGALLSQQVAPLH